MVAMPRCAIIRNFLLNIFPFRCGVSPSSAGRQSPHGKRICCGLPTRGSTEREARVINSQLTRLHRSPHLDWVLLERSFIKPATMLRVVRRSAQTSRP